MIRKHTEWLVSHYPRLYSNYTESVTKSCMAFGFECGDGWFDIIWDLSAKLEPLGVIASQVKEKYGTLRFYIYNGSDEAFDLIDQAELASGRTCEECGEPGKTTDMGWARTLCSSCEEKRYERTGL